jgi:hypothetical protein
MPLWGWGPSGGGAGGAENYASPTAAEIRLRTGLNGDIEDLSDAELDAKLVSLRADAEVKAALSVGLDLWSSATLTGFQVVALQAAVSYRVGAAYLRRIASEKTTGTEEPITMEEADSLRLQASLWDSLEGEPAGEAQTWDDLARGEDAATAEDVGTLETGELLPGPDSLDWYRSEWNSLEVIEVG